MKRKHLNFDTYLKQALKDPKVKAEYDRLQPEFALIDAMIKSRAKYGLTQKALAVKMGTKQSVISRIEIGRANPTFSFLKRLAKALNSNLEIRFN
ncbi:MAG: helix-turn-helix transcriptional regulator [Patescibacteria group bacterium]